MRMKRALLTSVVAMMGTHSAQAYVAHEWGTFTALVGSNGQTQSGMFHEDEVLPAFVHRYGESGGPNLGPPERGDRCRGKSCFADAFYDNERVTQKMETPVIYFYGQGGERVHVDVKFKNGIITETFPLPSFTYPKTPSPSLLGTGNTQFDIEILNQTAGALPIVSSDNIYGHARAVASNVIRNHKNELEKFIFYRGLGQFEPKIEITSRESSLKLKSLDHPRKILVHVDTNGDVQSLLLSHAREVNVPKYQIQALQDHRKQVWSGVPTLNFFQTCEALITLLVESGLYLDEARAMIKTWENGYLKVPGLRVLYIMSTAEIEATLPLVMTPAPEALERVFVGRVEVLLQSQEQELLGRVMEERNAFDVGSLGRFGDSILRRLFQVYEAEHSPPGLNDPMREVFKNLIHRASHST